MEQTMGGNRSKELFQSSITLFRYRNHDETFERSRLSSKKKGSYFYSFKYSQAVILSSTSDAAFHNRWCNPVGTTPVARDDVFFAFYSSAWSKNRAKEIELR